MVFAIVSLCLHTTTDCEDSKLSSGIAWLRSRHDKLLLYRVTHLCRLVSAAAARDQACSAYTTADDCLKKSSPDLLCDWDMGGTVGWDQGCHSTYLSEWTAFAELASNVGGVGAARAMGHAGSLTCPGSLAQKTLGCSNLYRKWQTS